MKQEQPPPMSSSSRGNNNSGDDLSQSSSYRRRPTTTASETSPLEMDQPSTSSSYATFHNTGGHRHSTHQAWPFWWVALDALLARPGSLPWSHSRYNSSNRWSWRFICRLLSILVIVWLVHLRWSGKGRSSGGILLGRGRSEWRWHHNFYESSSSLQQSNGPRNLLVAQVVAVISFQDDIEEQLADISGRPLQAYAKLHHRDYVRYTTTFASNCWLYPKALFLHELLRLQQRQREEEKDSGWFSSSSQHEPRRFAYDVVLMLRPDAMVTDLDVNVLDLLPRDKLLAVTDRHSDVVLFNLQHPLAATVEDLWLDLMEDSSPLCGETGNDMTLLQQAIESVLEEDDEDVSSPIVSLQENDQGFVSDSNGNYVMKGILSPPLATEEMRNTLQTTADSVCYRYYPQCEVL